MKKYYHALLVALLVIAVAAITAQAQIQPKVLGQLPIPMVMPQQAESTNAYVCPLWTGKQLNAVVSVVLSEIGTTSGFGHMNMANVILRSVGPIERGRIEIYFATGENGQTIMLGRRDISTPEYVTWPLFTGDPATFPQPMVYQVLHFPSVSATSPDAVTGAILDINQEHDVGISFTAGYSMNFPDPGVNSMVAMAYVSPELTTRDSVGMFYEAPLLNPDMRYGENALMFAVLTANMPGRAGDYPFTLCISGRCATRFVRYVR